jgi:hypothetical protein
MSEEGFSDMEDIRVLTGLVPAGSNNSKSRSAAATGIIGSSDAQREIETMPNPYDPFAFLYQLDAALGGVFCTGEVIEITGTPKSGKTVSVQLVA